VPPDETVPPSPLPPLPGAPELPLLVVLPVDVSQPAFTQKRSAALAKAVRDTGARQAATRGTKDMERIRILQPPSATNALR